MQQPQPLRLVLRVQYGGAGGIAAWPVQACDETGLNRVASGFEDDRDCDDRDLGRTYWRRAAQRRDDHDPAVDQIGREFRQSSDIVPAIAVFDGDVCRLHKTSLTEPLAKRGNKCCGWFREAGDQRPDPRYGRRLPPRQELLSYFDTLPLAGMERPADLAEDGATAAV
jgi:hypothetical protein